MGETVFYFAYGSNMDSARLRSRGISPLSRCHAILVGYVLMFNKVSTTNPLEGKANIALSAENEVEGILSEITGAELSRLDGYEGVSTQDYLRTSVEVRLDDGSVRSSTTYVAHPTKIRPNLRPTKQYLALLLAGAPFLSDGYVLKLRAVETLD
jgi:gamma-glutamylcyclotransferase